MARLAYVLWSVAAISCAASTALGQAATQPDAPNRALPVDALSERAPSGAAGPPPLHSQYAQYGAAINPLLVLSSGAICGPQAPCIFGSGGGLLIRGGYRSAGPWYIGGGYAFAKLDSSNLLRLGVFQQAWGEMRYFFESGLRATPYFTWGLGVVGYGNEWRLETGGAALLGGAGLELRCPGSPSLGSRCLTSRPSSLAGRTVRIISVQRA